jgi:trigger factor
MQITETLNEGLKRAYQITITGDDLETRVSEKLEEARPEIEMKGFRKGKVPMALLKKQFGPRLMGEAMQEAVDGAMQGHLDETGDRPAMQPEVKMVNDDWKEGDDVVVSMSYEKLPEIPEIDYKSIKLERLTVAPADADIDEALATSPRTCRTSTPRRARPPMATRS